MECFDQVNMSNEKWWNFLKNLWKDMRRCEKLRECKEQCLKIYEYDMKRYEKVMPYLWKFMKMLCQLMEM